MGNGVPSRCVGGFPQSLRLEEEAEAQGTQRPVRHRGPARKAQPLPRLIWKGSMNNSVSYLAYPDVKSTFDRVLMTTRGVRVKFSKHGEAVRFASRCNYFRVLDRKENLKIYKGHGDT